MDEWEQRAVESVRAGTPDLEAIYRAYRGRMKQTAVRKLGDEHNQTLGLSADDIVGNVIVDVASGLVKLKPEIADRLGVYLRGVVANYATNLIRRRSADTRARGKQHSADLTDIETDVETIVLAEQAAAKMRLLNDWERHVIVENVIKERPAKDVAADLGCTPQYISQLRKPALRKLFPESPFADARSSDHSMLDQPHDGEEEVR